MKILGLIPARYASTRYPGKPLAKILDKPMIQWVYERASIVFDNVFVATDDERIAQTVSAFGGKYIMTSNNHQSGTDRCAEALDLVEKELKISFDVVVNIQGDEPFVHPKQLSLLTELFSDEKTEITTLVKPFDLTEDIFNSNKPKVVLGSNKRALYFSRSVIPHLRGVMENKWQSSHSYYKHIGLYAYRSDVLREITKLKQSPLEIAESLEQLRWIENGYQIKAEITNLETIAIDTPDDLDKAIDWARVNFLRG